MSDAHRTQANIAIPIDISVGPTSASLLFSLQLVGGISAAARIPPQVVLPALTLAVSGWFLIFGLLGLGFIFDLIPVFFCIALVTALSIIVTTLQFPTILGILGVPNVFTDVLPGVLTNLRNVNGRAIGISIAAIVFLGLLSFLRGKWGKEKTTRGKLARMGTATGSLIVIVVFAGVSSVFLQNVPIQQQVAPFVPPFSSTGSGAASAAAIAPQAALANTTGVSMINPMLQGAPARRARRQAAGADAVTAAASSAQSMSPPTGVGAGNLTAAAVPAILAVPPPKLPFWAAFPDFNTPIPQVGTPVLQLAKSLFLPSFILFMSLNIEHIVVARFFAHEHGYTISKSQEMFSLGLINLVNSFFGGVPVGGGDMARSSILAFAGAKSPLNQLFTSVTVLIAMLPASQALRFLPQAALSAIILVTVFDQMPPQKLLNTYFKLSFADFLAFFFVMNIAIPIPSPINSIAAIGMGLVFMILYTMFRVMFKRPHVIETVDLELLYQPGAEEKMVDGEVIAPSTLVVKIDGDLIFVNAERMRRYIVDAAYLNNSGRAVSSSEEPERAWNLSIDRYVNSVRRRKGGSDPDSVVVFRPRLRMVILDFSSTSFVDTSALMSLELMKKQLRDWAGETTEFRFVGLNKHIKRRFERAKWQIVDPFGPRVEVKGGDENDVRDFAFESIPQALRYVSQDLAMNGTFSQIISETKAFM